jgi:hypothetical protein
MKTPYLLLLGIVLSTVVFAAGDNLPMGAKQAGMGNAAVASVDLWSVSHNQAGLAKIDKISSGIYASQGFTLSQFSQGAFAVAYPTKLGVFALSYNHNGTKLYNENKTGLAFAKSFGEGLRFGVQANLSSIALGENYGKKSVPTFEFGVQTKLMKNLWLGVHLYNVSRAKITNTEKIPVIARIGLNYTFNKNVFASLEYEKNWIAKPLVKAGLEYKIIKDLALRAGINAGANMSTFVGIGYEIKQMSIDAAATIDAKLGTSPHIGFCYQFNK